MPVDFFSLLVGMVIGAVVTMAAFDAWLGVQLANNTGHGMPKAFRTDKED